MSFVNATNEYMNMEQLKRIGNIIEKSDSFALLLNEDSQEYELLARKALGAALQKKNKLVYLFPETPKPFKEKWGSILPALANTPIFHSNSIRIPKKQFNIKEISYEDQEDFLTLNITSENSGLDIKSVIIESKPMEIGAVFSFGAGTPDTNSLKQNEENIVMPPKERIISINKNGEAVAEKIHRIIKMIDEKLLSSDNISTILFASLFLERVSSYEQSRGQTLELEKDLLRFGADKKFVSETMMDFVSLEQLPIV